MTKIHVGSGRVVTGPVGGDGPWTELGYTTEDAFIDVTFEDDEPIDMGVLRRGLTGGQIISIPLFTMTRRQMRNLMRVIAPKTRNRRRNPLHAVRDRLRRHHRERFHGRR